MQISGVEAGDRMRFRSVRVDLGFFGLLPQRTMDETGI